MPITPFHFGPGAALHCLAPRRVSFIAFCAANVLIDIEPLYYMVRGQFPLHRFFHTYLGATLITLATILLFFGARRIVRPLSLPNLFQWQHLSTRAVAVGAALGAYSHIVLDSVMHSDIRPFAPFSDANPLLEVIPLSALHWFCLIAGIAGLGILSIQRLRTT